MRIRPQLKQERKVTESPVAAPVISTNADELNKPGTSNEIFMDVDIPANSPSTHIRKRKLQRRVLKNMKAAVMSTHVIANVNKDKVAKLLAQAIRLQDPPDREETFIEQVFTPEQVQRRSQIYDKYQDVIVPDDTHIAF